MLNDERVYVIRYNDKVQKNCIPEHMKIEDANGYCWFAKCGSKISERVLNSLIKDKIKIILYSRKKTYIADLAEFKYEIQNYGYPEYYENTIFQTKRKVAVFLKLFNITEIDGYVINKLRAISTGRIVSDIFWHSSCSNVFAVYLDTDNEELFKRRNCSFLKNGVCENKTSITYGSECFHAYKCDRYS